MKTDDFDFELPLELIAQSPILKRDESKLLVMDRKTGEIKHEHFYNIISYLNKGDVLVLNDTKVIPARLFGIKEETEAHIEVLLLYSAIMQPPLDSPFPYESSFFPFFRAPLYSVPLCF